MFDNPTPAANHRPLPTLKHPLKALSIASLCIVLAACDPDRPNTSPLTARVDTTNQLHTDADVSRFLARAGFGATTDDLRNWRNRDAADWLRAEFDKPAEPLLPQTELDIAAMGNNLPPFSGYTRYHLHRQLIDSDAELRTKATYALSQIFVVGGSVIDNGQDTRRGIGYHDTLHKNAFGNFRELLRDVTYSPAMAIWLTYLRNAPGDPATGREPDENYARELLQLFTIGLNRLNPDGTLQRDANGDPIPTYDNDDVAQLARVFTGFSYDDDSYWPNGDDTRRAQARDLRIFEDRHSTRSKVFLGTVIPAGLDGPTDVSMALDHIFAHPNIAPFISRQLIQRFTASHPSPAYVRRVSAAFESGAYTSANNTRFGSGARGDLEATLAAVLLDASLFEQHTAGAEPAKVREPLLKYVHFMRTFKVENLEFLTRAYRLRDLNAINALGMEIFRAPSVFGYYRPGYIPPMTLAGENNQTVPEFQLTNTSTVTGYINVMTDLALEQVSVYSCPNTPTSVYLGLDPCNFAGQGEPFAPDYSAEIRLARTPNALVEHLNTLLLGDRMPADERQYIVDTVAGIPIETDSTTEDLRRRVQIAILMVVTSPHFSVLR